MSEISESVDDGEILDMTPWEIQKRKIKELEAEIAQLESHNKFEMLHFIGKHTELEAKLSKFEWQPIETAPTAKRILVCVPIVKHRLVIAFKNNFGLFLDEQMQPMQYQPFWWMPLPESPKE